jgi:histidyl-tRNA synthetase
MRSLPGFRDFYPDDCARRNYILATWREVARRYGFVEYDGPVLEPIDLYRKKSGSELIGQLFDFTDKGERHVAMRPEMTPTLARMVAARERDFKKPLKWFCVPQFFRYEKQQRGRLREFYQLNCDIIGEASAAADAELIALTIDTLRAFGFTKDDFVVRICDRSMWVNYLVERGGDRERAVEFLQVIDKIEREPAEVIDRKLEPFGVSLAQVREFMAAPHAASPLFQSILADLGDRGLSDYVELDAAIVRGLAYYTGLVFEVFDRQKKERALAGGGRYDNLLCVMSDGKTDLPALGFGMGDVVLANMIADTPAAAAKMQAALGPEAACEVYVVVADESRRPDALALVQQLRDAGFRADYPLDATKIGRQFQSAEHLGARHAVVVGAEWPDVKFKTLATRQETLVPHVELAQRLRSV